MYVRMYVCVWHVHVSVFSHSPSAFTGRIWDAYWVTAVVSPVLFIVMFTKGILMALKTNIFKKFFITHILTMLVSFDIHTQTQLWETTSSSQLFITMSATHTCMCTCTCTCYASML